MITWESLTKAQQRFMNELADDSEPLSVTSWIEVHAHEERTAIALELKGLIKYDGDAGLTELGLKFLQENQTKWMK
jgi:hypothetical protein